MTEYTTATSSHAPLTLQWLARGVLHAEYSCGGALQQPLPRTEADVRASRTDNQQVVGPAKTLADPEEAQWHTRGFVSALDTKADSCPRI